MDGVILASAIVDAPDFQSANGFLSAGGVGKFAKWQVDLDTRDFDISSVFKADKVEATSLVFVLWAGQSPMHLGLDPLFRESGAWAGPTLDSGLSQTPLNVNSLHTLRLVRTSGMLAVFFDGSPVPGWQSLSLGESITAVGWRPHRNTVHIQSLENNSPCMYTLTHSLTLLSSPLLSHACTASLSMRPMTVLMQCARHTTRSSQQPLV